ncbi:exonuclease domain-containing protein [Abyssalbus ytuae]|uniref:GIY-YIG nuclease family protein n=1 Tax=Abyssalbus ytuae TaxID=2926907 RepID=A0A9E6ZKX9_9FLAO|nr:exonuclease domain-containing protein [Abyssalbus ytuae]UOB17654.1 GIY-YIG nuclease family protein [Abyssalbus ytuae]
MYAILDIETTGGKYNEEGITEIAIYKYDGHKVVDRFISLVNPEREIQPFVVNLTGINNNMLRTAPKFYEVAKRIVEITEGCIIVAHNSQFDYRILRTEFRRLGYDYKRKTLCTVELSKRLIPGKESYSLGKLVRSLGIPVSDRHRANGDAQATVKLFKLLLTKDTSKTIVQGIIKKENLSQLTPKFLDIIEQLPASTGVYYIHKNNGEIIYIGKSKNIKRRVNQHLTGTAGKAKKIQKEISAVTYEETGSELIAMLKESEEIKMNKPVYNRSQKKTIFNYSLYEYPDENGYLNLKIDKADARKKAITSFSSIEEAKNFLYKITDDFNLCQKLNGLHDYKLQCFGYSINQCFGACILKEPADEYNKRVEDFLKQHSYKNQHMVIVDKGREIDERSAILIENGIYKGFGFYNLNYQINNFEILKSVITPMQNNRDVQYIIQSYLRKKKVVKIINL